MQTVTEMNAVKAAARERDGYCCTGCGMTNAEHLKQKGVSLHVHRMKPGSVYTLDGCTTLCNRCHGQAIRRGPGEPELAVKNPPFQLRLDTMLHKALKRLAERNASDMSEEIRIAVRERLERVGLWPLPPQKMNREADTQADGDEGEG